MQARVSMDGQVVIPEAVLQRLGIHAGDPLEIDVDGRNIILTAPQPPLRKMSIITDPLTGWPVLDGGPDAPVLTSEMVYELLADFP